jgi:hypothetical protein
LFSEFSLDKGIVMQYTTNYYPQGNEVLESTSKNLILILKNTVTIFFRNFHNSFPNALCTDRVTLKEELGTLPYYLIYGQEAILPTNISIPTIGFEGATLFYPSKPNQYIIHKRPKTICSSLASHETMN